MAGILNLRCRQLFEGQAAFSSALPPVKMLMKSFSVLLLASLGTSSPWTRRLVLLFFDIVLLRTFYSYLVIAIFLRERFYVLNIKKDEANIMIIEMRKSSPACRADKVREILQSVSAHAMSVPAVGVVV